MKGGAQFRFSFLFIAGPACSVPEILSEGDKAWRTPYMGWLKHSLASLDVR